MPEILFVCSVNRFRSVIAAEYFRMLLEREGTQRDIEVSSAGTWAREDLSPLQDAVQFAHTKGFEVSHVRSREVNTELLKGADLVIVMGAGHREAISYEFPDIKDKIVLLSEVCTGESYDVPDLGESEDDTAEDLGEEICALIDQGYSRIIETTTKRMKGRGRHFSHS